MKQLMKSSLKTLLLPQKRFLQVCAGILGVVVIGFGQNIWAQDQKWDEKQSLTVDGRTNKDFKCGEYVINGYIGKRNDKPVLLFNRGATSETVFNLPNELVPLAEAYDDRAVVLHGRILKAPSLRQGKIEVSQLVKSLSLGPSEAERFVANYFRDDLYERIPNPLNPQLDSSLSLIKQSPCQR